MTFAKGPFTLLCRRTAYAGKAMAGRSGVVRQGLRVSGLGYGTPPAPRFVERLEAPRPAAIINVARR